MAQNINRVVISGNLTRDPELRHTAGGSPVCSLRIAVNGREKRGDEWQDRPDFFDVTVWGSTGERCAEWLAKGRKVFVDGRLRLEQWENDEGQKRSAVKIVADRVEFVGSKKDNEQFTPSTAFEPASTSDDFGPSSEFSADNDDFPF